MSTVDRNKELAGEFCRAYTAGDWASLEQLCTDDFRWKVPTSQRRQSAALATAPVLNESPGWTRAEALAIFRDTQQRCVDGRFDLIPVTMTAEGDRVAV